MELRISVGPAYTDVGEELYYSAVWHDGLLDVVTPKMK
jgi:hypothetical protein